MKIPEIRRVLSVGAGTMGKEIGVHCAAYGYDVTIYDVAAESLKKVEAAVPKIIKKYASMNFIDPKDIDAAVKRVVFTDDPKKAAEGTDLLIESVTENPDLKREVFSRFNDLCPEQTIFTTNTSMLLPSMLSDATGRPDRFCAFHFHLPIWLSNVADIMPHPGTSARTTTLLASFAKSINQVPIVLKKEKSGYVFNTMLSAIIRSALSLAERDVASVEDVDRAWMGVMKTPIGPFGIMDMIGLDTVWHITSYWAEQTKSPEFTAISRFVKDYIDEGYVGMKGGRGFYTYPDPAFQKPGFLMGE
jgi:3-hydroxybutyryl-CoA dehydrogenase